MGDAGWRRGTSVFADDPVISNGPVVARGLLPAVVRILGHEMGRVRT